MLHNDYISYKTKQNKTKQRDKKMNNEIKLLTYISFDKRDLATCLNIKWDKGNCTYCDTWDEEGKKEGNSLNETFTLSKAFNDNVYFYCFLCQTWIEAWDKTGVIRRSKDYGKSSQISCVKKKSIEQMLLAVQAANEEFLQIGKELLLLNRKNV
jgi:hypothetical protein